MNEDGKNVTAPRLQWSPIMSLGVLAIVCVIEIAVILLWPISPIKRTGSCAQIANAIDIAGDCSR